MQDNNPTSSLALAELGPVIHSDLEAGWAQTERALLVREGSHGHVAAIGSAPPTILVVRADAWPAVEAHAASDKAPKKAKKHRQLGPANILTVPEAIAELGMGKEDGREWLEAKELVRHPGRPRRGSGRVIASEFIDALKSTRGRPGSRRLAPTKLPLPKTDRF